MKRALVLVSGGLDSVCAAYYASKRLGYHHFRFLHVFYGQRAAKEELFCVKKIASLLKAHVDTLDLSWLHSLSPSSINSKGAFPTTALHDLRSITKGKKDILRWWVPCRNTLFLFAALAFAESAYLRKKERYDIFVGFKQEGQLPMKDATKNFLDAVNQVSHHATYHDVHRFKAPLLSYDKNDLVMLAQKLEVPLEYTYSCYAGGGFKTVRGRTFPVHCGVCLNCRLRQQAFYWTNLPDPSLYKEH